MAKTNLESSKSFRSAGRHRTAVLCVVSLLIGLSFFVRHIAGILYTHSEYSCLVYNPKSIRETPPARYDFLPDDVSWDESRAYARWTNEVIRGELGGATLGSFAPFLTSSVPQQPLWLRDRLGPMILAEMARLPDSDVRTAFLAADLIFPVGAALALFVLCWEMRPSVWYGIAATSLVLFFNWQDVLNFLAFLRGARQNEAIFLRTPYPQFSMIVFCLFLWSLLRLVKNPTLSRGLLFVALLDLNFFTYFYSWTYALMFAGSGLLLLGAVTAVPGLNLDLVSPEQGKRAFLSLLTAMGLGFVLAFPVWLGIIRKNPAAHDDFLRLGGTFGHAPELRYTIALVICLLALLWWKDCPWKNRWFAMAFLLASFFVLNIQVVIGKTIQPAHWTGYYIQPIFLILLADLLWTVASWENRRVLPCAIAIVLLTSGVVENVYKLSIGARQSVDFNRRDPDFEQVLELFRQPALRSYGFLSNDAYVSTVLPAFVTQKPLLPWYMDPETDGELASLQRAAAQALDSRSSSAVAATAAAPMLTLRTDKILFVLNLHRPFSDSLVANRRVLLRNDDFLVLAPVIATQ